MVKTHEDTDDVLQNTFVKVYRNIAKYRSEAKLYTWLYKIATNESLNHFRKIERNKAISIDDSLLNDAEELEDYLIITLNKAIEKASQISENEMAIAAKSGMPNIPGMDMFK